MGDVCDQVDAIEQRLLEQRLIGIRNAPRELNPVGDCYWCAEPFEQGSNKLFCDSDCANDYEKFHRNRR